MVVKDCQVLAELPLEIAGLMSDGSYGYVIRTLDELEKKARSLGVPAGVDPFVTLSFLALTVLPAARITLDGTKLT